MIKRLFERKYFIKELNRPLSCTLYFPMFRRWWFIRQYFYNVDYACTGDVVYTPVYFDSRKKASEYLQNKISERTKPKRKQRFTITKYMSRSDKINNVIK